MASVDSKLNQRTQVSRGRGLFVNRSTRNAQARQVLQQRTGRAGGGRFTIGQLREAIANQGTNAGRRLRRLR